jgi:hypothetical protein
VNSYSISILPANRKEGWVLEFIRLDCTMQAEFQMQCELKVTVEEICMFLCKKRQQQKIERFYFILRCFFLQPKKKEIYLCPSKKQHKVMFVNTVRIKEIWLNYVCEQLGYP